MNNTKDMHVTSLAMARTNSEACRALGMDLLGRTVNTNTAAVGRTVNTNTAESGQLQLMEAVWCTTGHRERASMMHRKTACIQKWRTAVTPNPFNSEQEQLMFMEVEGESTNPTSENGE